MPELMENDKCVIILPIVLPSLNEYINKERLSAIKSKDGRPVFIGNSLKRQVENKIAKYIADTNLNPQIYRVPAPVWIDIFWYMPNSRRDLDNIMFGAKFLLDSLKKYGIIEDDSQKVVKGITHYFRLDKEEPHIVVVVERRRKENENVD